MRDRLGEIVAAPTRRPSMLKNDVPGVCRRARFGRTRPGRQNQSRWATNRVDDNLRGADVSRSHFKAQRRGGHDNLVPCPYAADDLHGVAFLQLRDHDGDAVRPAPYEGAVCRDFDRVSECCGARAEHQHHGQGKCAYVVSGWRQNVVSGFSRTACVHERVPHVAMTTAPAVAAS